MPNSAYSAARESIAFGPTESFIFPIPVGFVRQRETFGAGETKTSKPVRIDHGEYFSLNVFCLNDAAGTLYNLGYQTLISSDGIDGANGEYKNALWGSTQVVIIGAVAATGSYSIDPVVTQAIRVVFTNNGAAATAATPLVVPPNGRGVHVRVGIWS